MTTKPPEKLSPSGLAAALVQYFDLHEGFWEITTEFVMTPHHITLTGFRLVPVQVDDAGPNTVDASEVNPAEDPKIAPLEQAFVEHLNDTVET